MTLREEIKREIIDQDLSLVEGTNKGLLVQRQETLLYALFFYKNSKTIDNGKIFNFKEKYIGDYIISFISDWSEDLHIDFLQKGNSYYLFVENRAIDIIKNNNFKLEILYRYIFLLTGFVSNLGSAANLELKLSNESNITEELDMINSTELFTFKLINKNDANYIYTKKINEVIDFLKFINVDGIVLKMESEKVMQDVANNIRKQNNMEFNNMKKTSEVSAKFARGYKHAIDNHLDASWKLEMKLILAMKNSNLDMSINELLEAFAKKHPDLKISRATVANWIKKVSIL